MTPQRRCGFIDGTGPVDLRCWTMIPADRDFCKTHQALLDDNAALRPFVERFIEGQMAAMDRDEEPPAP